MPKLVPRDLPTRGGFSIPAGEIRWNTYQLYERLTTAAETAAEEMRMLAAMPEEPIVPEPRLILQVQLYSRAVQVFAAMAIEAALNTYGLVRFGSEQFDEYEKKPKGPRKKLVDFLDHKFAQLPGKTEPITVAIQRLTTRRNALVHQRSDESMLDDQGRFTYTSGPDRPNVSIEAAGEALEDMETFFEDFPKRDPQAAAYLHFSMFDV